MHSLRFYRPHLMYIWDSGQWVKSWRVQHAWPNRLFQVSHRICHILRLLLMSSIGRCLPTSGLYSPCSGVSSPVFPSSNPQTPNHYKVMFIVWGAVVVQWIRPQTLNHEVPDSNMFAASVVLLAQSLWQDLYCGYSHADWFLIDWIKQAQVQLICFVQKRANKVIRSTDFQDWLFHNLMHFCHKIISVWKLL